MNMNIIENFTKLNNNIKEICRKINRNPREIRVVAVSKNQPINKIKKLLEIRHLNFGENRFEEANQKWVNIKKKISTLHFIGALQSKKVSKVINLFNVIETLDSENAAKNLAKYSNTKIEIFIQINIGEEVQKRGVLPTDFSSFLEMCKTKYGLSIGGAMCMPPINKDAAVYFKNMRELCYKNDIYNISMGMSNDFKEAIIEGSTNIRVGNYIFGKRT